MARVKKVDSIVIEDEVMEASTPEMALTSILSDDKVKDDTKVMDRKKRAQNATVAFLDLGMIDRMNIMSPLKIEFMKSVHKMRGDTEKQKLMLEFLETAREIVNMRFEVQSQVVRQRRERYGKSD